MYPNNTDRPSSIFELVDNDFFVNFLMDQPQQQQNFHRVGSNPNLLNPQFNQYQLIDQFNDPNMEIKQEDSHHHERQPKKQTGARKKANRINLKDDNGLLKENNDLFTYKNNLKNTYINKITQLISQEQVKASSKLLQTKPNKFKPFEDDHRSSPQLDMEDSQQAKLIRNRECARNSRKRKKIYIELLENRVKSLNEELDKTKRILKTSASYFSKMSQNQQLQGFFLGRQQLYEKLDKAIQSRSEDTELNLLLDSMRFRVGGGGKERVNASNYFFNQILEICFPIHVRYMLQAAAQSKDLFAEPNEEPEVIPSGPSWTQEIVKELDVTEAQRKQMKKSQRRIISDKNKLEELLTQFQDIKEQLYAKTSQVENFIDELRNILTPMQVGKFLISLEKNKYRKEMNISRIWSIFDGQSDQEIDIKEEDSIPEDPEPVQKKVHL